MITSIDQVLEWLGDPAIPEDVTMSAWQAAEAYVGARVQWEETGSMAAGYITLEDEPLPAPEDLVKAVDLLTARYLARRNSPDGIVGLGDMGPANVPVIDRDIERLMDPWRFYPVA